MLPYYYFLGLKIESFIQYILLVSYLLNRILVMHSNFLIWINRPPGRGVLMNIIRLCVIIFFKIVFLLFYIGILRLEICWDRILKVRYFSIDWSDKVRYFHREKSLRTLSQVNKIWYIASLQPILQGIFEENLEFVHFPPQEKTVEFSYFYCFQPNTAEGGTRFQQVLIILGQPNLIHSSLIALFKVFTIKI